MKWFICILSLLMFSLVGTSFGLAIPNETKIEKHFIKKIDAHVSSVLFIKSKKLQEFEFNRCMTLGSTYKFKLKNKIQSEEKSFKFKEPKLPDKKEKYSLII